MTRLQFDINKFNFHELITGELNCEDLEQLHLEQDFIYRDKFERKNDQSTHYHKKFYNLARTSEFEKLYRKFINEIIKPYFENKPIVYQTIPTFRLHFPGNIAVGEFHRDRNYREDGWPQKVKEVNFFLPFTRAYNTNTIWVESAEGKEDFSPMEVTYGTVVAWDGSNLLHGNKTNEEITTRVSVDFRVMLLDNYTPSLAGSINTSTKFAIGGYYSLLD